MVDDSRTVRRLVRAVLEENGYQVTDAADGQQALDVLKRDPCDLVLVDFVMPRLNGYQFAQALRSIPSLRGLPIVLMSAKADQIGERFMRHTGAVDAITKPFSPEALLAVVAHVLGRGQSGVSPPTLVRDEIATRSSLLPPPSVPAPSSPDVSDIEESPTLIEPATVKPTVPDMSGLMPKVLAQAAAAQRFSESLARKLAPVLTQALRQGRSLNESVLNDLVAQAFPVSELVALARDLRTFDADLRGPIALEGDIARVPLGEVLQLLRLQRQTGVLNVERQQAEVSIAFREGQIDLALARGISSEFLLGRYVVAEGWLTREQLEAKLRTRTTDSGWLGEQLVREGVLTASDLERVLTRQTSEIIYEVLRWKDGRYRFEHGVTLPEAQSAYLSLPVESLVLEGFRRVDEWRMIEQEITSFDRVLARDEAVIETVGTSRLTPEERTVLEAIDGKRTVREIVSAVSMSSFDTCKVLYRLLRSKLVRKRTT